MGEEDGAEGGFVEVIVALRRLPNTMSSLGGVFMGD